MEVRKLKESLTKNELRYRLAKRGKKVAMYHVLATYSDRVNHIEVFIIPIRKPDKYTSFFREGLPSDEEFGKQYESLAFCGENKFEQAERHYRNLDI